MSDIIFYFSWGLMYLSVVALIFASIKAVLNTGKC